MNQGEINDRFMDIVGVKPEQRDLLIRMNEAADDQHLCNMTKLYKMTNPTFNPAVHADDLETYATAVYQVAEHYGLANDPDSMALVVQMCEDRLRDGTSGTSFYN